MEVIATIADFRQVRPHYPLLGLVATMGSLHEGHLSLIRRAKQECGAVAVSIFVNPTQFGPRDDFSNYPRDMARDLALLRDVDADLVFAPASSEIYPQGTQRAWKSVRSRTCSKVRRGQAISGVLRLWCASCLILCSRRVPILGKRTLNKPS